MDSLLVVGSVFLGFRLVTEGLIHIHGLTITARFIVSSLLCVLIFLQSLLERLGIRKCVQKLLLSSKCVSAATLLFQQFQG